MLADDRIQGILGGRKQAAENYANTEAKESRDLARSYYNGELFGNEVEDRSQVILTDVRDKINAIMPSLMKVFTAGDKVVTFRAANPQDVEVVKLATPRINTIVMEENEGFRILYTWFFDALLEKNGITKAWVEEVEERVIRKQRLLGDMLDQVEIQEDVEILSADLVEGEEALYDVEMRLTTKEKKIRVANVAPELFGIDPSATTILDSTYCYEECRITRSEAVQRGYPKNLVDDLPAVSTLTTDRNETPFGSGDEDDASTLVEITEHYATIDIDEDGKAEKWRVVTGGDESVVLEKEEWSGRWPYFDVSPAPRGHEFYGISMAEEVMDLQSIKSTIMRQWLDNIYGINNNRLKVYETASGQVNMDDVLNKRVDGVIRIRSAPGGVADVVPMPTLPIGDVIMPVMGMLDEIGEVRTGVSKFGQGLNPDVLHKTPATTAGFMMTAAQEKQALIARIFAETGVKHLFKYVYDLERENGTEGSKRVGNGYQQMNPQQWPRKVDCVANVGLGTGNKQQQQQNIMSLVGLMDKSYALGMVSEKNLWNAAEEAVDALGYRHAERFFTDPSSPEGQQLKQKMEQQRQQAQQQGDALQQGLLQIEQAKVQHKNQLDQAKLQLEVFKVKSELQLKGKDIETGHRLKLEEMIREYELEILKLKQEGELEGMELGLETSLKREEMALQARLESKKINIDTNIKDPNPT